MTLVECMLAILILSISVLAVIYTTNAGYAHLRYGDTTLRAIRLAENLVEEILSRPYSGNGSTRSTFCIDDYDGFSEDAGHLHDATGNKYPDADQALCRMASITLTTLTIPDLDSAVVVGKTIVVTVRDAKGNSWRVSRFIPEPM